MSSSDPTNLPTSNDTDWAWKLILVCAISFGCSFSVVSLRAYVRARIVRNVGYDDWIMFFACALATVATTVELLACRYGLGKHTRTQTADDVAEAALLIDLNILFCNLGIAFGKISVCASILQILKRTMKSTIKFSIWAIIILSLCINVAASIIVFAQCTPTHRSWDKRVPGTCLPPHINVNFQMTQAAFSAFTDILLSLLPILILRNVKLSSRAKLGLEVLMGLGLLTALLAIIRLIYTQPDAALGDLLLTDINVLIWATLERNFALVLASLPTLIPLFKNMPSLTSTLRFRSYLSRSKLLGSSSKRSRDSKSMPLSSIDDNTASLNSTSHEMMDSKAPHRVQITGGL